MSERRSVLTSRTPAEVYDEYFVPALFLQWGSVVAETAGIGPGQRVLDVACGSGVLSCAAADRTGPDGYVVGLDPSRELLTVARRKRNDITWREGRAESLPFPDDTFDAVVSQFGMMFFGDPVNALREMMRVLRPGGQLVVAVWDALDHSPANAVLTELLHRLFGEHLAEAFRAPFVLGDPDQLRRLFHEAGVPNAVVTRHDGKVRFASIGAMVSVWEYLWTVEGLLSDVQFVRLREQADASLRPFVQADGTVVFDQPALLVTATGA